MSQRCLSGKYFGYFQQTNFEVLMKLGSILNSTLRFALFRGAYSRRRQRRLRGARRMEVLGSMGTMLVSCHRGARRNTGTWFADWL
jgi:hypothetical protein